MIGARHAAGSMISNGGDSSPSKRVIVGAVSCNPPFPETPFPPEKRSFYECALSIIATVLPSEKTLRAAGTYLFNARHPPLLLRGAFRYRNSAASCRPRGTFHPKFTACQAQ